MHKPYKVVAQVGDETRVFHIGARNPENAGRQALKRWRKAIEASNGVWGRGGRVLSSEKS